MTNRKNYIGEVYNNLTVIKEVDPVYTAGGQKIRRMLCKCTCVLPDGKKCGNEKVIRVNDLKRTLSCGCVYKATRGSANLKHGHRRNRAKSKEHQTWCNMKQRCLNPNNSHYEHYAGRGITICEEWARSFEAFYRDMGDAPGPEYSIERINNNGNYEPSNCIWATNETQQRNSRNTKLSPALVSYIRRNKHKYTVEDLALKFNVCKSTIRDVLKYKTWRNIANVPSFLLAKTWGEILTIYS